MNRLESLISFLAINPLVDCRVSEASHVCRFCDQPQASGHNEHTPDCLYTQAIADLRAVWKINKEAPQ